MCRSLLSVLGLIAVAGTIAIAQPPKDTKPAKDIKSPTPTATPAKPTGQPELPPGMTEADMKACAEAATPGPMHEYLALGIGVWTGKSTMWMTPEADPVYSECTSTVTAMMGGRYTRCEIDGEMPGMGPFNGFGIYGYDNVAKKFQSTWIDNCGTGMMTGTGDLSADGKTLTWTYTFNCPITRKPTVMREVERRTGKDSMTLEMFGADPHTGKEFKMMEIAFTRNPNAAPTGGAR